MITPRSSLCLCTSCSLVTWVPPSPPSSRFLSDLPGSTEGLLTSEHASLPPHFPLVYSAQCRAITRQLDESRHVPSVCERLDGRHHDVFIPWLQPGMKRREHSLREQMAISLDILLKCLHTYVRRDNNNQNQCGPRTLKPVSSNQGPEVTPTEPLSHLGMLARTSLLQLTSHASFLLF